MGRLMLELNCWIWYCTPDLALNARSNILLNLPRLIHSRRRLPQICLWGTSGQWDGEAGSASPPWRLLSPLDDLYDNPQSPLVEISSSWCTESFKYSWEDRLKYTFLRGGLFIYVVRSNRKIRIFLVRESHEQSRLTLTVRTSRTGYTTLYGLSMKSNGILIRLNLCSNLYILCESNSLRVSQQEMKKRLIKTTHPS